MHAHRPIRLGRNKNGIRDTRFQVLGVEAHVLVASPFTLPERRTLAWQRDVGPVGVASDATQCPVVRRPTMRHSTGRTWLQALDKADRGPRA